MPLMWIPVTFLTDILSYDELYCFLIQLAKFISHLLFNQLRETTHYSAVQTAHSTFLRSQWPIINGGKLPTTRLHTQPMVVFSVPKTEETVHYSAPSTILSSPRKGRLLQHSMLATVTYVQDPDMAHASWTGSVDRVNDWLTDPLEWLVTVNQPNQTDTKYKALTFYGRREM